MLSLHFMTLSINELTHRTCMSNEHSERYDPDQHLAYFYFYVKDGPTAGAVGEAFAARVNSCPPIPHRLHHHHG